VLQIGSHLGITQLGINETSTRRGHNYATLNVDMIEESVILMSQSKGNQMVAAIGE